MSAKRGAWELWLRHELIMFHFHMQMHAHIIWPRVRERAGSSPNQTACSIIQVDEPVNGHSAPLQERANLP